MDDDTRIIGVNWWTGLGMRPVRDGGALKPLMGPLVDWLTAEGYALTTSHNIVRAALRLGDWMNRDGITIAYLDSGTIAALVQADNAAHPSHRVAKGLNPEKWTRQCVLSGGEIDHSHTIGFEVNRCSISKRGVPSAGVVPDDPPEHLAPALIGTCPPLRPLQRLPLQGRIHRFGLGIIGTRPDPAHRLHHPQAATRRLERRGRILTPVIRMHNRTG